MRLRNYGSSLRHFSSGVAQTSAHYRYRFRSCLRLIISFLGTRKLFSKVKKNLVLPPKRIIGHKQNLYHQHQERAEI